MYLTYKRRHERKLRGGNYHTSFTTATDDPIEDGKGLTQPKRTEKNLVRPDTYSRLVLSYRIYTLWFTMAVRSQFKATWDGGGAGFGFSVDSSPLVSKSMSVSHFLYPLHTLNQRVEGHSPVNM